MALTIFEDVFGTTKVRREAVNKRSDTTEYVVRVTDAVQSVVDTFRDPRDGKRYVVSLSEHAQAYTDPMERRVVISYKPLFDKGLKLSVAATVMLGLTLHEVGHTLYTFPLEKELAEAFGDRAAYRGYGPKNFNALAYVLVNIGDDARLEYRMAQDLPIARDVFPTMLHWMALNTGMVGQAMKWDSGASLQDRVNFMGRATRYPWTAVWSRDTATRAERLWWQEWKRDYCLIADGDGAAVVAAIKVALDHLKNPVEYEPDPEEPGDEPGDSQGEDGDEDQPNVADDFADDDDEDEDDDEGDDPRDGGPSLDDDDEDWGDEDEDEDDDESDDEPGDEQGEDEGDGGSDESEGEDDESESEGSESEGEGLTESEGEGDEPTEDEGEPNGGTNDGESADEDGEDESDEDYAEPTEMTFDAAKVDGDIHHLQDDNRYNGRILQEAIEADRRIERVNSGVFGTAKVTLRSIDEDRYY